MRSVSTCSHFCRFRFVSIRFSWRLRYDRHEALRVSMCSFSTVLFGAFTACSYHKKCTVHEETERERQCNNKLRNNIFLRPFSTFAMRRFSHCCVLHMLGSCQRSRSLSAAISSHHKSINGIQTDDAKWLAHTRAQKVAAEAFFDSMKTIVRRFNKMECKISTKQNIRAILFFRLIHVQCATAMTISDNRVDDDDNAIECRRREENLLRKKHVSSKLHTDGVHHQQSVNCMNE